MYLCHQVLLLEPNLSIHSLKLDASGLPLHAPFLHLRTVIHSSHPKDEVHYRTQHLFDVPLLVLLLYLIQAFFQFRPCVRLLPSQVEEDLTTRFRDKLLQVLGGLSVIRWLMVQLAYVCRGAIRDC